MLAARSEVLEMLGVKDGRWFGRLDDDSPSWVHASTVDRCYA